LKVSLKSENIIVILLIICSVLFFFHPYEWIAGARDPGVYVSTGVHIAKSGSIFIQDPLLAQMNTSIQEALYDVEPANVYGFISWADTNFKFQFPGFFITNLDSGTITPQFLHVFPIWIAIFYSIFGLFGIFYVNPIFGVLSIISLYLVGKTLFSWKIGVLAGLILILNFAQIWYARYPFAEIMTQFFILSGLMIFIQFSKSYNKYLAIMSGLLFGLAFLTKIESLVLLLPFFIYYAYKYLNKELNTAHYYFLACTGAVLIYSLFDYLIFSGPYFNFTLQIFLSPPPISILEVNANKSISNLDMISLYETVPGIILAFIGIILILFKKCRKEHRLIALIALSYSIFLFKTTISPDHPWWVRRFVPAFLPICALFTSYALYEIIKINKFGKYLSFFLAALLITNLVAASYPIMNHSEGKGMIEGVSELSNIFNENDIIIMGFSMEGGELSTPLYYIYDKNVIYLYKVNLIPELYIREMQTPDQVSKGIDYLLNNGHNVYMVFNPGNMYMDNLLFYLYANHKIEFIKTHNFSYRHLEPTLDRLPENKIDLKIISNIYKVSSEKPDADKSANVSIDMGTPSDSFYIEKGFYGPEKWDDDIFFRWTSGNASIRIPTPKNNSLQIIIYAEGFRPAGTPPANFSIYLNEYFIGNFTAQNRYEIYNMTIIKNYLKYPYSTLRINSSTWTPSETLKNGDVRELGIKINNILIEG